MNTLGNTVLLSTKLKIPAPRKNYIVRKALFDELRCCTDMGVVFVRGGAGTGKTTLLSSFLRETGLRNVSWVSLDDSNTNVYSFWLYFTTAISALLDDGDDYLTLVRSNPNAAQIEPLLTLLINRLAQAEDCYLVLDDVHHMKDDALLHSFEFFIGAMPPNFHIFMLSREDPPIYLGPLAMAGRLLLIDGRQMQLTPSEGMAFLQQTLQLNGSEEDLKSLNEYAEGWVGGLQLAAAAGPLQRYGKLLRAGGGIAAQYLTHEVIEALAPEQKAFLTQTGCLSYFDAGICCALFDQFTQADFENMVATLVRKNLFIICIDETAGVYRYHNILQDYLAQQFKRLPAAEQQALLCRAALAFEQCGDSEEALRQYCTAGNYTAAMRVAQDMGGRIEAWSYLDQIPYDVLLQNADLAAQCFLFNMGTLNIKNCRTLFEGFKQQYGDSDIFNVLRFAESYVSKNEGVLPEYNLLTARQISVLPFGPVVKAMVLVENAIALVENMQYEEAESCIKDALNIGSSINVFVDFFAYNELAQIYEETGRLNDSLLCYEKSRVLLRTSSLMSWYGTNYYFGLLGVYMRQMQLDKADEFLVNIRCLLDAQHSRINITDMTLAYHEAEMEFLRGQDAAGAKLVDEMLVKYPSFSTLNLARLLHELACANRLPPALANKFLAELDAAEHYRYQPFMRLLRARLLFTLGDFAQALHETDEILTFSRLHANLLRLVEAGLQKAVLLAVQDSAAHAREIQNLLREAVHYAQQNRILMPFYLDRRPLLPLLLQLARTGQAKNEMTDTEVDFLSEILALCGYAAPELQAPDELSARELQVLQQLALGITNREIAANLCISPATVKTHVLSIFGKLGVSSRMMAVEAGRTNGLLP